MARPPMTLEVAQRRITEKFPGKGLKLVDFIGAEYPCILHCPEHGEVRASTYANVLRSKSGCPKCGKERGHKLFADSAKQRISDSDTLRTIKSLLHLSDPELGAEVRRLLSTSDT